MAMGIRVLLVSSALAAGAAIAPVLAQGIDPLPVVEDTPIDTGQCAETTAGDYGGTGAVLTCLCKADEPVGPVWGSDTYTDDSAICTAARHRGVIGARGGRVSLQMLPGQSSYRGSQRRGVTSGNYGSWNGSYRFVVVGGDGAAALSNAAPLDSGLTDGGVCGTAVTWRGQPGRVTCLCPVAEPNSARSTWDVWGTGTYTDDSYICKAAIHAGAIGRTGGRVTFEMVEGQASYRGSDSNGVTSSSYGSWGGSFRFVE